ncbi:GL18051 [Drosophila persimilis]|uniref:GL18051 n=1 Tax=Drosophila persimilis TaxID=7234 RepID=B4HAJ5_DROPE|nr:GL18051 [Drosophila persimilis]
MYFSNNVSNRQGDDSSVGPVGSVGPVAAVAEARIHEAISHTCLSSSAEYELALILKELRWITDQLSWNGNLGSPGRD